MSTTSAKRYGCSEPATEAYATGLLEQEDAVLQEVRARAARAGLPDIHVSAADGRHLMVLAAAVHARRVVEVGTLAGYSGVCLLRGMAPSGFLHTLELEPRHAQVAQDTFRRAGLDHRVRIHVGPAVERLRELAGEGPFDLVFLDADKAGYPAYLDWAGEHLRPGGLVLADNAFLGGYAAQSPDALPEGAQAAARAMQAFNRAVVQGPRFLGTLLPTGEGLALGVRRP